MAVFQRLRLATALIITVLFFMVTPVVHAAGGHTWVNDSALTGNSATSGKSWKAVSMSSNGQYVVAVEELTFFPVMGGGDIWISDDSGTTWTDASLLPGNGGTTGLSWTGVASSANGQDVVAVADSGGVWTSHDGGTTWTYVANFTMSGGLWQDVTISADGQYMTAVPFNGDLWSSSDGGDTWRNDTWLPGNGGTHQSWTTVAGSADGQRVVAAANGGAIWTTVDGGTNWIDNSTLPGNSGINGYVWQSVGSSANGQTLAAVVYGGGIWISSDGGATWAMASGTNGHDWQSVTVSADGQNLAAVNLNGDISTSNDAGSTWVSTTSGGPLGGLVWLAVASNITGGSLVALERNGDIYSGTNTAIPQVITASQSNAGNGAAVTIQTPSSTTITCSSTVTEASLPHQDTDYQYPLGLTNLCYTTVLGSDQVTLTFVTDLLPSQVVARDFNATTGTFTTISGAVITQITSGGHPALQVVYTVADNGPLDSNLASNLVTDPVGLGVLPAAATVGAPDTGLPSTSLWSSILPLDLGAVLLLWSYRRLIRKS